MKKTGKILTIVWSILGILIIFLSAGILLKQKMQDSRAFKEDKEIAVEVIEEENNEESNVAERAIYIHNEADMQLLKQYQDYNSDVIGYMSIDGTVLDHPLVQTISDEEYYLYKDLDKNYNSHGVPFLSAASLMEGRGRNCIIYGHNISKRTKDVFADLAGYRV